MPSEGELPEEGGHSSSSNSTSSNSSNSQFNSTFDAKAVNANHGKFNVAPLMQMSKAALIAIIQDIANNEGIASPLSVIQNHVCRSKPVKADSAPAPVGMAVTQEDNCLAAGQPIAPTKMTKAEKRAANNNKEFKLSK
jgi:N-methylhydantoinase B/oxoprolinase/acetone carboxylase alpha subunit